MRFNWEHRKEKKNMRKTLQAFVTVAVVTLMLMAGTTRAFDRETKTTSPLVAYGKTTAVKFHLPGDDRGAFSAQPATVFSFKQPSNDSRFSFENTAPPAEPVEAVNGSVLYMVANSHIDTQWNWTVQDTIRQWVPRTFFDNFKLFEQYPNYKFNFEGVIHYMFFKEYHPEAWSKLQSYVAQGRWKLAGSWIDAVDTNVPSPESLMRQALYGKRFFKQEFGTTSKDIYLPDCFGFSYALPSIAAHTGMTAFSTQKLTWGGWIPAPFSVGRWEGVDGSSVVAALRGGDYTAKVKSDPSLTQSWNGDLTDLGNGKKVGFRYFGVGDQGGAPDATSVSWVERGLNNPQGSVHIRNTSADQLSKDLTPQEVSALPVYKGELVMKTHGVGCYTSQAAMKKWNRKNEQLADAAERASIAAEWVGGTTYPRERLREAWTRFLFHQFHDDLTGTCIPQAYVFSWNDELISLNQFASTITDSVGAVASGMDTRVKGMPLVIYNPLAIHRRDVAEATIHFNSAAPSFVRVFDPVSGAEVPSQIISVENNAARILLLADVPSIGFKVYDVQPAGAPSQVNSNLSVANDRLENARYRVKLDANGDVASVFDKEARSELLQAPAGIELFDDESPEWPAWEVRWEAVSKPPVARLDNPTIKIIERGPVRVALEITRQVKGSTFVQRVSLSENGDRVDFDTQVDWKTTGTLVKASFPLHASNPKATFDLGLGAIERGNSQPNLYEVPAQQWADITDAATGSYGVSILNNSKYGWDKPADNMLRLSLLHTPVVGKRYIYQATNDIGHHRFIYSITGHVRDWRDGDIPSRAARLNQPLEAFQTAPHRGRLGTSFSMLHLGGSANQVAVRAFKKAEDSDEIVLRLQELYGKPALATEVTLAGNIASVREINAAEEETSSSTQPKIKDGKLVVDLKAYQPRSFALKLRRASLKNMKAPQSISVALPFNLDGISTDDNRQDGDFDGKGRSFAAELLPSTLMLDGIKFKMGDATNGSKNVLACQGQRITLPKGDYNRLYIIAAAVGGDTTGDFTLTTRDGKTQTSELKIQEWSGVIGQWDSRLVDDRLIREAFAPPDVLAGGKWPLDVIQSQMVMRLTADKHIEGLENLRPAFIKRDEVAWIGTHRHAPEGNEPYILCNLFKYEMNVPKGATTLTLPDNIRLRIMSMSVAQNVNDDTKPAGFLYE